MALLPWTKGIDVLVTHRSPSSTNEADSSGVSFCTVVLLYAFLVTTTTTATA